MNENICCGYSKEPSKSDGSFEQPKCVYTINGQEIMITISHKGNAHLDL